MATAILATIVATAAISRQVVAHSELFADEIEKYMSQKSSEGRLKYELRPIFLSPTSNVHETMIAMTFGVSGILGHNFNDKKDVDFIKGVYWNDSPERGLCPWCPVFEANMGAIGWYRRFTAAQKLAIDPKNPKFFTHGDPIMERSQFGDLAVIHSMAIKNGIPARETKRKAMVWAEFAYKAATGVISENTKIRDVRVLGFDEFFNEQDVDVFDQDLVSFFKDKNVKHNALGSLLHFIQDSYAAGHVERTNLDGAEGRFCRTAIKRFLAYPDQDTKKHSAADKWPPNLSLPPAQPAARICDPLAAGAAILKFFGVGAEWEQVRRFLDDTVFPLQDAEALSGPGEDYAK